MASHCALLLAFQTICLRDGQRAGEWVGLIHDAAIDLQQLAIDEAASVRAEQSDNGCDIVCGAKSSDGVVLQQVLKLGIAWS